MSYGVPCVATPLAAEGMGLTNGKDILVGKDPREFSDLVEQLYSDKALWTRLSENSIKLLEEKYSLAHFSDNLKDLLSSLE